MAGIELDKRSPRGHDGRGMDGQRYFTAKFGHGIFATEREIIEKMYPPIPQFRITELSKLFMVGFIRRLLSRSGSDSEQHIPEGIQIEIIQYVNWYFVRLRYDVDGDCFSLLRRPSVVVVGRNEKETTVRSMKSLFKNILMPEGRNPYMRDLNRAFKLRLWMKFEYLKYIYPLEKEKTNRRIGCSMEEIMEIEKEPNRWVELPDDHLHWGLESVEDIDKLLVADGDNDKALEFGVSSMTSTLFASREPMSDSKRQELNVGDIVDARDVETDRWSQAVIRYVDDADGKRKFIVHYIGRDVAYDNKVNSSAYNITTRNTNSKEQNLYDQARRMARNMKVYTVY